MAQVKAPDSKIQRTHRKKQIRQSVHHFAISADLCISIPVGQTLTIMDGHRRLLALRRLMNETASSIAPEFVNEFVGEDED